MTLKESVHRAYLDQLEEKIAAVEKVLADLKESGTNETKSTAGDKHETALAMLQIEQANTRQQLAGLRAQLAILKNINPRVQNQVISAGALIKTNDLYFFISAALGKIKVEDTTFIALSLDSPLGAQFRRSSTGDSFILNGKQYSILSIE